METDLYRKHNTEDNWDMSQENLSSGLATRWDTNGPAQLKKLARVLEFRVQHL